MFHVPFVEFVHDEVSDGNQLQINQQVAASLLHVPRVHFLVLTSAIFWFGEGKTNAPGIKRASRGGSSSDLNVVSTPQTPIHRHA